MPWDALHEDRLLQAQLDPVWVLTLTWRGTVFRLATRQVDVVTAAGESLHFDGWLSEVTVDQALEFLSASPSEQSLSLAALELPGLIDGIRRGWDPVEMRGELALWLEGVHTTWEDRIQVLVGRSQNPVVYREDVIDLTLSDDLGDDRGRMAPYTAKVDLDTWTSGTASYVDAAEGEFYPVVFGEPGVFTNAAGATRFTTGAPAWYVDTSNALFLVAGHRVAATQVRLINEVDDSQQTFSVTHMDDGYGRTVAVVDATSPGSLTVSSTGSYWSRWIGGGGLLQLSGDEAITGAGDLLEWMLERSTVRFDRGRWMSVRDALNDYKVSGYIDNLYDDDGVPLSPTQWVAENLLPILPLSLRATPQGIAPVLWRFDLRAVDVQGPFDVEVLGSAVQRIGGLSWEGDPAPEIALSYAPRAYQPIYHRTRLASGVPETIEAAPSDLIRDIRLDAAWLRHVARSGLDVPTTRALQTDIVYDEATAAKILLDQVAAYALPHALVSYAVDWSLAWIEPGMAVLLTDTELGIEQRVAICVGRSFGGSELDGSLSFRLLESPSRDVYRVAST